MDGVLAHTKGVPELDGVVTGTRHNLSVVSRESHAEHILCVADKPPCSFTTTGTGGEKRSEENTSYNSTPLDTISIYYTLQKTPQLNII